MTLTTTPRAPATLRAEIAWLGPIMGAVCLRDRAREVTIAGAEDPALGKSFCAVLVPVVEDATGHFKVHGSRPPPVGTGSDRNGWFHVVASADLWAGGVEGALLVLLYNQSSDLLYYTFDDLPVDKRPSFGARPSRLEVKQQRLLPEMPPDLADAINKSIDPAIASLLEREPAKTLRKGLAVILDPALVPSPCGPDRGAAVPLPPPEAELVVAVASCQYPSSIFEDKVAGASYARLGEQLSGPADARPQCLLLVGDQIYVDGTAGLFDPTSQFDRYVRPYEILYGMKYVRNVLRRVTSFMMLDDHEIIDNWEPHVDDTRLDPVMIEGRSSYIKFQRRHGPELQPPVGDSRHPLWYPFRVNGFPLFMADTRTERTCRTPDRIGKAEIMSDGQCKTMLDWLAQQPHDVPKMIASPAILLPRHARAIQRGREECAVRSDSWDGYPRTLERILAWIAHHRIPNVVFVSGDEHLSCVARAELETKGHPPVVVHSVLSSPLYAPFPFANSERADLVASDDFMLASGKSGRVCCHVQAEFGPPGDGYSVLRFTRDEGGWTMQCRFDRAAGGSATIARKLY